MISKKSTGIMAAVLMILMVSTAFVPAVNALSSSSDADSGAYTYNEQTPLADSGISYDLGDGSDLSSMISSLFGGADISSLLKLLGNVDLKSILADAGSMSASDVLSAIAKQAVSADADVAGEIADNTIIDEIIEFLKSYFAETKTVYIAHFEIGGIEFIDTTISVVFDDEGFEVLDMEVSSITVPMGNSYDADVFTFSEIELYVAEETFWMFLGNIYFDGVLYELDAGVGFSKEDYSASLQVYFSGVMTASVSVDYSDDVAVYGGALSLDEIVIPWNDGSATVYDFTMTVDTDVDPYVSVTIESAFDGDGNDITEDVEEKIAQDFIEVHDEPAMLDYGNIPLTVGPVTFSGNVEIVIHHPEYNEIGIRLTQDGFYIGDDQEHRISGTFGTGSIVAQVDADEGAGISMDVEEFTMKEAADDGFSMTISEMTGRYAFMSSSYMMFDSIGSFSLRDQDGDWIMGGNTGGTPDYPFFYTAYQKNFDGSVANLMAGQNYLTRTDAKGVITYEPGFMVSGTYSANQATGAAEQSATIYSVDFHGDGSNIHNDTYADIKYRSFGPFSSMDIRAEYFYGEQITFIGETHINHSEQLEATQTFGAGIGRSVNLGGDNFFYISATTGYGADQSRYFTLNYDAAANDEKFVWNLGFSVGDDGVAFTIRAQNLFYQGFEAKNVNATIAIDDGNVTVMVTLEDVTLGNSNLKLKADSLTYLHSLDSFTGQESYRFYVTEAYLGATMVSENCMYSFDIDQEGKFTSAVMGDMNVTFYDFEIVKDLYINGNMKIENGALVANMGLYSDSTKQTSVGNITISQNSVDINQSSIAFGPFTNLSFGIAYGNVATSGHSFSFDKLSFDKPETSQGESCIKDVSFNGTTFSLGSLYLKDAGTGEGIKANGMSIVIGNGYTIGLQYFLVDVARAGTTVDDDLRVELGSPGTNDVKALEIKTAMDGEEAYTEMTFFVKDVLLSLQAEAYGEKVKASFEITPPTGSSYVRVYVKEDANENNTAVEIENLSAVLNASRYGETTPFASVGIENFTYKESTDASGAETVSELCFDSFQIQDYDLYVYAGGLTRASEDNYVLKTFYIRLNDDQDFQNDGDITIAVSDDAVVVTVPKMMLMSLTGDEENHIVLTGLVLTIDGYGSFAVEYSKFTFDLTDFYFLPTESTITGTLSFDSQNPKTDAADVTIDQIKGVRSLDVVVTNLHYLYAVNPITGAEATNMVSFDSLNLEEYGISTGQASFDFVTNAYSLKNVVLENTPIYGTGFSGSIGSIFFKYDDRTLIPDFEFSVTNLKITETSSPQNGIFSDAISVKLSRSESFEKPTISFTADGDFTVLKDQTGIRANVSGLKIAATSTQEWKNWTISGGSDKMQFVVVGKDSATIVDMSADRLTGKMTLSDSAVRIDVGITHDDKITYYDSTGIVVYEIKSAGSLNVNVPIGTTASAVTAEYKEKITDIVITAGSEVATADINKAEFTATVSYSDANIVVEADAAADLSFAIAGRTFSVSNCTFGMTLGGDQIFSIENLHADAIRISNGDYVLSAENITFEDGGIIVQQLNIADSDKADVTFVDAMFLGTSFFADYMYGAIDGVDVRNLTYDVTKDVGERIDGYMGLFYFDLGKGITAFKHGDIITPPEGALVIRVPDYDVTFTDEMSVVTESYTLPAGSIVALDTYYDVVPDTDEYGIPVTTDSYLVQNCDVFVTKAYTILDLVDEEGVIMTRGSGVVFDSDMLAYLPTTTLKIVTPQGITVEIGVDSLKKLASGVEYTMLGVTMEDASEREDLLGKVTEGLSADNKTKVMSGIVISVDTGRSVNTSDLGNVSISVSVDIEDDAAQYSVYHLKGSIMAYNGLCTYSDGYLTFTVNHFSDFLICENLDYAPSEYTVYVLAILLVVIAVGLAAYFAHRRYEA